MNSTLTGGNSFESAASFLSVRLQQTLCFLPKEIADQVGEIRLRVNQPVALTGCAGIRFVSSRRGVTVLPGRESLIAEKEDLTETYHRLCEYSVHSFQNQIKNGFITVRGGHRAGLCGTAVAVDGEITGIRGISAISLRVARQVLGAADPILPAVLDGGVLLAGAPGSGKTTILRDLARQLSGGDGRTPHTVVIVDERGELAGSWQGERQTDLGPCCDVLDGFPKAEGIVQAIRTLSPQYIICDEVGTSREAAALEAGLNAGVRMVVSVHAGSREELARRETVQRILSTGAFETVVLLSSSAAPGRIQKIYRAGELFVQGGRIGAAVSGLRAGRGDAVPQAG